MIRDVCEHDTAGSDFCTDANLYVSQDLCSGSDEYSSGHFRVAVTLVFTRSAQGYIVQNGHVVSNHSGFSDDQAGGMIDEDTFTDTSGWVDIDSKLL